MGCRSGTSFEISRQPFYALAALVVDEDRDRAGVRLPVALRTCVSDQLGVTCAAV
jgi:hypothetical protein